MGMKETMEFVQSGIIESYVLGLASLEEMELVEQMSSKHEAVAEAIDNFCTSLEEKVRENAVEPPLTLKPMVMAAIDYTQRLMSGEKPSFPPLLQPGIKPADFEEWLNRPDMVMPVNFDGVHAKIIGFTPQSTTAIVWLKDYAPSEVHGDEHEKFLILEGTCNIIIDEEVFSLKSGDFLQIPLHKSHRVVVTSTIPCKVILQRVAA